MAAARSAGSRPNEELLTVPQAAERLNVSTRSVQRMVASGKLAAVPVGDGGTGARSHYRIPASEVARYVAAAVVKAEQRRTPRRRAS